MSLGLPFIAVGITMIGLAPFTKRDYPIIIPTFISVMVFALSVFWLSYPLANRMALWGGMAVVTGGISALIWMARHRMMLIVKILIGGTTALFMMSWGGQGVAAPILVPFHIFFIRCGSIPTRVMWLIAASLITMQAAYVYTYVFQGFLALVIAGAAITLGVGGAVASALTPRADRTTEEVGSH